MVLTQMTAPVVLHVHVLVEDLINLVGLIPLEGPAMPKVTSTAPPGAKGFEKVLGWAKWVSLGVCVIGLIAAGAAMAIQSRHGDGGEHLGRIGMVLFGVVIISAAATMVSWLG